MNTLKNTLADCGATKSVVGLDDEGNPIFWDMEKGNLLAAASMGTSMDYLSCCLPIFSMTMRFSPNEFQFFYLKFLKVLQNRLCHLHFKLQLTIKQKM